MPREVGRGKYDPRAEEEIFLGYSEESKAYRIWSPKKKKFIISRYVKFTTEEEIYRKDQNEDQIPYYVDMERSILNESENQPQTDEESNSEDAIVEEEHVVVDQR